jgi:hypothetical protein
MPTPTPGELTAVSIAALDGGALAQVVVDVRMTCFARLHADGEWSAWRIAAEGVRDASVTADPGQGGLSALIAVVLLVPVPVGVFPIAHTLYQGRFFRLTADGVTAAVGL